MPTVQNNLTESRFDIYERRRVIGFLQYEMRGEQIWLTHTEFCPRFEERFFPESLIRDILDDIQRQHLAVLPFCSLVRHFIASHTQYLSLVPAEELHQFGFATCPELVS